jgi:hypothetical protein
MTNPHFPANSWREKRCGGTIFYLTETTETPKRSVRGY